MESSDALVLSSEVVIDVKEEDEGKEDAFNVGGTSTTFPLSLARPMNLPSSS